MSSAVVCVKACPLLVLLFSVFVLHKVCSQFVPSIHGCEAARYFPENTTNGSTLFNVTSDLVGPTWTSHNNLFHVSEVGQVILIGQLDRDFEDGTKRLTISVHNTTSQTGTVACTIIVSDVNDNPPEFQRLPYDVSVSENATIGVVLLQGLSVSDRDTGGGSMKEVEAVFPDTAVEQVFSFSKVPFETGFMMNISLAQTLDRESRSFYSFWLVARDKEGLNTTTEVKVSVTDVQDTPPFFLLDGYRAAIKENRQVGASVIKVSAEDGDRDRRNTISYSFVSGSGLEYFTIAESTGEITCLVSLDRDNETVVGSESAFQLVVRATENNDTWPQYGNTTTDVLVVVMVEDVNDNAPVFGSGLPYTAAVREDVFQEAIIYFDNEGYIFVSDRDQGQNSHFNLTVERDGVPFPALAATPSDAFSEALVLLRVKDASVFRNNSGIPLSLQLVAREVSTAERYSSTAMVVIVVEKEPEPPATAAPVTEKKITESDVVVFVIGFLVVFNIVVSGLIICILRRKTSEPKQGLKRKGSKYYINGLERKRESGGGGEDTVMEEVEGKDRCDVMPLSAVLSETGKPWSPSTGSTAAAGAGRAARKISSTHSVNFGDMLDVGGPSAQQSDRRILLAHEAAPDRTSSNPGSSAPTLTSSPAATATADDSSSATNFSRAKRNVTAPQNPALSFSGGSQAAKPPGGAANAANYQLQSANRAASPTPAADTEPVTRFSSNGVVSTSVAARASSPVPSTSGGQSGSGNDASGGKVNSQVAGSVTGGVLLY